MSVTERKTVRHGAWQQPFPHCAQNTDAGQKEILQKVNYIGYDACGVSPWFYKFLHAYIASENLTNDSFVLLYVMHILEWGTNFGHVNDRQIVSLYGYIHTDI